MRSFIVAHELETIYEVTYVNVVDAYAADAKQEQHTKAFASEEYARKWKRENNVHVRSFCRVTKLEM